MKRRTFDIRHPAAGGNAAHNGHSADSTLDDSRLAATSASPDIPSA
jgi:hypothetical protein